MSDHYSKFTTEVPRDPNLAYDWIVKNNLVIEKTNAYVVVKNVKYKYNECYHLTLFVNPDKEYKHTIKERLDRYSEAGFFVCRNAEESRSIPEIEHWHIIENPTAWVHQAFRMESNYIPAPRTP